MKVSLNTLKNFTKIIVTPEELRELIAERIGEVESFEYLGEKYKNIKIAEIKEVNAHPDADKLNIYQVDIGDTNLIQVVAGDKTLQIGDKVCYFPPNTKVPNNQHPEKYDGIVRVTKLRGVESNGMLASAKELDISGNHEKVLRLNDHIGKNAKNGQLFSEVYGLDDYIYEIENKALVNRPECFGMIGLAREVSAIQGLQYQTPDWFKYWERKQKISDLTKDVNSKNHPFEVVIKNEAGKLCPRYMAVVIDNIELGESPLWMQLELMKSGMKPVSNVVDVTNYLMLLTGQPLHAFDFDKVVQKTVAFQTSQEDRREQEMKKANITVRTAKTNEEIIAINGDKIKLDDQIVIITDGEHPIGIGGVMGGLDTEIDENTKTVILECANFDMYNIRKTSNKIGITSEATTRYSRSQDPEMCETVIHKALDMFAQYTNGSVASKIYDDFKYKREEKKVEFTLAGLNKIIGNKYLKADVLKILKNVELNVEEKLSPEKEAEIMTKDGYDSPLDDENEILVVDVPTYRQDLNIKEDIYEEISRIYGFNKIPLELPLRSVKPVQTNKILELESTIKNFLVGLGAYEVVTYNFISGSLYRKINPKLCEKAFRLINSISPELEYMRTMLVPNLLDKAYLNLSSGHKEFVLFELNKYHIKGVENNEGLPYEFRSLALVYTTDDQNSKEKYQGSPYYSAKKYLDELIDGLKCAEVIIDTIENSQDMPLWLENMLDVYEKKHTGIVKYIANDKMYYLGVVGEVNMNVKKMMKLPKYTSAFEINVEELQNIVDLKKTYNESIKFPKIIQDLCFILPMNVGHKAFTDCIKKVLKGEDIYYEVESLDIYQDSKQKDEEKRQETIRIYIRGVDKMLSPEQIEIIRNKVVDSVCKDCNAVMKGV